MPDKKTLDYYVAELRRVEKSRQAGTEKEVEKIYKNILKELNHFLADEYANYSDSDGKLSVGVLNLRARYAKFLQEVDKHLNTITPDISAEIKKTVESTYKSVYKGMVKAVEDSADDADLHERLKNLNLRPEVIKNAVENPISGLTLPDTLERHRQEIIYGIKQQINIGLMTGERYDTMAKNINKTVFGAAGVGGLYGKSKNIVRTEVHRVQESGLADSAKDIMQGLEGSGLVEVAIWRTMKDERVRPQVRVRNARGKWKTYRSRSGADHQKMEGKAIVVGDKFEVESGVFAECPGESGTARNDCNCRCFIEYRLVDIEEAARLTGKSIAEIRKIAGITEAEEKENAVKNKESNEKSDRKVVEAIERKEKTDGKNVGLKQPELTDVYDEYIKNATPGLGEIIYEDGYKIGNHKEEIRIVEWLNSEFGGDIKLLCEAKESGIKTPDAIWHNAFWEFKSTQSINGADKRIQDGLKQIYKNPGGIILTMKKAVPMDSLIKQIQKRFNRNKSTNKFDIIIIVNDKVAKILRFTK